MSDVRYCALETRKNMIIKFINLIKGNCFLIEDKILLIKWHLDLIKKMSGVHIYQDINICTIRLSETLSHIINNIGRDFQIVTITIIFDSL